MSETRYGVGRVVQEHAERFTVELASWCYQGGCRFHVERKPDGASPAMGDWVILKYDEQEQYASVIMPTEPVAAPGLWSQEHGHCYQVPAAVLGAGLTDISWHNDTSPSFCWPEDKKQELRLWVEYPVVELRESESTKRYLVQYWPDVIHDLSEEQTHFYTDDLTFALARMHWWRRRIVSGIPTEPDPPVNPPASFLKAHGGIPAGMTPGPEPTNLVPGPRFVLLVGSIQEQYPDVPAPESDGAISLWDRQERKEVARIMAGYAQAICFERDHPCSVCEGMPEAPFTSLVEWFNHLSNEDLQSEGIPITR